MRCLECAERNSVAARKCEFCGSKFKKRPFPLSLKLACGGVAIALTASLAASLVVPKLVDPEENLGRVAKKLAAGPSSVDQANKVKTEFSTAVKNFLKTSGDDKAPALHANLQKLLPSSAFEVHVVELPRGLRVVEIDTVLQATSFLVMKTNSGTKVFDLPGFEVFDDARILNDSAGPVLALLGHSSGPPPHKPMVRTYALLPDYIADETEKLVPSFKVNGTAKFAKNNQDIQVEFNVPAVAQASGRKGKTTPAPDRTAFGNLKWKDARYSSDFSQTAALVASRETKAPVAIAAGGAPATVPAAGTVPASNVVATPPVVAAPPVVASAPAQPATEKIVVRSFTAADAARSTQQKNAAAMPVATSPAPTPRSSSLPSDSVMAAVPMAAPALKNAKSTIDSISQEFGSDKKLSRAERRKRRHEAEAAAAAAATTASSSRSQGQIIASGATLRSKPSRGGASMNSFGNGTAVSVLGKEGDWYHVRVNGQDGYIFSSLVSVGHGSAQSGSSSHGSGQSASTSHSNEVASASQSSHSSRRHRSRHSSSGQNVAQQQEAMLVADATTVRHKRSKHQVAASEPILVP